MAVTITPGRDGERSVLYNIGLSANGDVAQAWLRAPGPAGLLWQLGHVSWWKTASVTATFTNAGADAMALAVATAAVAATGSITVTGTATTVIPADTVFVGANGQRYETDAAATIPAAGTIAIASTALVAGSAGNAATTVGVTIETPIDGVTSAAISTAFTGGTDTTYNGELDGWVAHPNSGDAQASETLPITGLRFTASAADQNVILYTGKLLRDNRLATGLINPADYGVADGGTPA